MMLVVSAITGIGLYLAQRSVTTDTQRDLEKDFESEIASLHRVQDLRNAALAERCLGLASKPRIHAALEDNALDLLYPSAQDELRDLLTVDQQQAGNEKGGELHAHFYRFLDGRGAVIQPKTQMRLVACSQKRKRRSPCLAFAKLSRSAISCDGTPSRVR